MRHVVFRVGPERFAIPLDAVREVVVPQPPFARVPRSSDAVRGVMNLRGRVVAVVDLAALLGLAPQPLEPPDGGAPDLVRGVAAAAAGAVTVLGAGALATEAERLFGAR